MSSTTGYVYAIGIEATTYVKIGRAASPKARMANMQVGLPFKLELIYSLKVEHPALVEDVLHQLIAEVHVRGEWFEMPELSLPALFDKAVRQVGMRAGHAMPDGLLQSRLRRAIGYRARTQKEVAEAIGLSQKSMSKLMRGETINPGANLIYALAMELDVSMDYLFGLSDEIERKTK